MSGFSAEWLGLREPADHAARPAELAQWLASRLQQRPALRILDLGAGTGSNLRYLAPFLPQPQDWTLVDHDAQLLASVPMVMQHWQPSHPCGCRSIEARPLDLARDPAAFALDGHDLVTTAALLDLVAESWLVSLVDGCRAAGSAVLFALSYDGRAELAPVEPEDPRIVALVNEHQRSDKGFGPALGPDGAGRAGALLEAAGYEVRTAASDWQLGPDEAELQCELLRGWADAARQIAPAESAQITDWLHRRLRHIAAGAATLRVGHLDLAGILA